MTLPCQAFASRCIQAGSNSTLQIPCQSQDHYALVTQLKACALQKDLFKGSKLHTLIIQNGLLKSNIFVGNTLIHMYAKCGSTAMAKQVFDELDDRTVVSWNALITGYVEHEHFEEAFHCFEQMQGEGLVGDAVTLACILKACGITTALNKGKKLHAQIVAMGLLADSTMLGNSLVGMYAKCGALMQAQKVLEELPSLDVVSWNALISGCCHNNCWEEALCYFERMKHKGISPDAVTFSCILKACGGLRAVEKGKDLHAEIAMQDLLGHNVMLGSALVDMYAKAGELVRAQQVFDELKIRDVVSWTTLIMGFCQYGQAKEALICLDQMKQEGLYPDSVTFTCILKACSSLQAVDEGRKIHAEVVRKGFVGDELVLGNALVDMYSKCCELAKAHQLFDELWIRDTVSWSVLITEYCQRGQYMEATDCYRRMKHDGLSLDSVTFSCLLKACGILGATDVGNELYSKIQEKGLLKSDSALGTALVDMYAKCGELEKAEQIIDELPVQNVTSWNALITGYCQHGCAKEAFSCYQRLKHEGLSPDAVTYACILQACGRVGSVKTGIDLHAETITKGLLEESTVLGSALVDMYGKCGALVEAQYVFDKLFFRDVVSWTGLISGYCRHGLGEEAVDCYRWMEHEGLSPDAVTFASVLKACGNIGRAAKGREIHAEIARTGLLEVNTVLGSALVDMYAKCGALGKSQETFDELCVQDVGSWSALITGYSEHGYGQQALNCFEWMIRGGVSPDAAIYACILKSCGSLGSPEKTQTFFECTSTNYGVLTSEHYTCRTGLGVCADQAIAVV